jgi:hypothetical protein
MEQTAQGTLPLIKNRDVGEIFAEPVDEQVKPKKLLRKVVINFSEYSKPPYRRKGVLGKRSSISIPDAKRGLSWRTLKTTVDSYVAGNVFVSVSMDSGRMMEGYFVSKAEGEKVLTRLAALSTADLIPDTFRASEGKKTVATGNSKQVHVQSASLLYPKKTKLGDTSIAGKPLKVTLWNPEEPADFKGFV